MNRDYIDKLSKWVPYKNGLCEGCFSACCTLPVEANLDDLIRMGYVDPSEAMASPKKIARRLIQQGIIKTFRAKNGIYTLEQTGTGDCIFLDKNRLCSIYEKRPEVCRLFPKIGPRPGFCPGKLRRPDKG